MPSPSATGVLSVAGATLQAQLGQGGVGQPGDVTCVVTMYGVFSSAQIAVEGVPLGSPLVQPTTPGPQMGINSASPLSPNEWIAIEELGIFNGQLVSSPITISSSGGPSSGVSYTFGAGVFEIVRLRLISISSGAVQGVIAFVPFPISTGLQQLGNAVNQLELSRIRTGISALMAGGADAEGFNLQDLSQADFNTFV